MILDDIIKQVNSFLRNYNDDIVDRFYYVYTVIGLSIYLLFITSKQYYGDLIQCNFNKDINAESMKYMQSICWMNGTYMFKRDSYANMDFAMTRKLDYYQWIIFIIVFKIFLLRIPSLIWSTCLYLNGFDMVYVSQVIMSKLYLEEYAEQTNFKKTQKSIEAISDHLRMTFLKQKYILSKSMDATAAKKKIKGSQIQDKINEPSKTEKAQMRKSFPNLTTKITFPLYVPYLFVKVFYIAILAFNVSFLTHVFQFNYLHYGFYMTKQYFSGAFNHTFINEYFPKNGMCDVQLMDKHDYLTHSVICALPINLFNEMFYFIYWYWLVFLFTSTVASIFHWLMLSVRSYRRRLVLNVLQLHPNQNISRSYFAAYYLSQQTTYDVADSFILDKTGMSLMENFELFFNDVCSTDIIFTLKMISLNSNSLAIRDILNNLWLSHYLNLSDEPKQLAHRPVMPIKRSDRLGDDFSVEENERMLADDRIKE